MKKYIIYVTNILYIILKIMLIIYYINKIMFVFKYQPMHQGRKNEDNHNVICRQYDCGPRLSKVN